MGATEMVRQWRHGLKGLLPGLHELDLRDQHLIERAQIADKTFIYIYDRNRRIGIAHACGRLIIQPLRPESSDRFVSGIRRGLIELVLTDYRSVVVSGNYVSRRRAARG